MKKILFLILISISGFAQTNKHLVVATTVAELKTKPVEANTVYLLVGKSTIGDNGGALYWFDQSSLATEDLSFGNVITSGLTPNGRFLRVNTKKIQLPHGILSMESGLKTFMASATTNSSGECLINLTYDNTPTGVPIYTSKPVVSIAGGELNTETASDVIFGGLKFYSSDFKQVTFKFARGNSSVISILGVNILGTRAAAGSTPVTVFISGM